MALAAKSVGVVVVHGDGVQKQMLEEAFVANVAVGRVYVFLPIFVGNH